MKKKQILIVEDERIVADDIRLCLERLGHEASGIAHSGEEAIEKVKKKQPDLVLMDIVLEGKMDGIEAAAEIRSQLNIPVVYLTAYADKKTLERAKITEPFGYIIKPFEDTELRSVLEIAFYKHSMESRLKESKEWLSTTLESIGEAVIATGRKGQVTFMNPVAQTLTGWKQEEAKGKPMKDVFQVVIEETAEPIADLASQVLEDGRAIKQDDQTLLITKTGKKIPIDASCTPIKFRNGNIDGAVLVFQDISERKKTMDVLKRAYSELKRTQQELIQSEKLAALGRFSSGIAHEIKNPLGIILSGVEFLEAKLAQADKDITTITSKIKESTLRANDILQGLLKFARPSELIIERIKPEILIKETLALLRYRPTAKSLSIKTHFEEDKIHIKADKTQMIQALLNLLMNSVEAMPKGGEISVKAYRSSFESFPHENLCVIEIRDTGEGISRENLPKVFEPFFTTRRDKRGTGLGLSMTKMIVDNHRGYLELESHPGKGTTAKILLPLA